jgi:hypothetical protein
LLRGADRWRDSHGVRRRRRRRRRRITRCERDARAGDIDRGTAAPRRDVDLRRNSSAGRDARANVINERRTRDASASRYAGRRRAATTTTSSATATDRPRMDGRRSRSAARQRADHDRRPVGPVDGAV